MNYLEEFFPLTSPQSAKTSIDPGDGSDYSKIHAKYHDILRHLVDKFGYNDLFLIDPKTGDRAKPEKVTWWVRICSCVPIPIF